MKPIFFPTWRTLFVYYRMHHSVCMYVCNVYNTNSYVSIAYKVIVRCNYYSSCALCTILFYRRICSMFNVIFSLSASQPNFVEQINYWIVYIAYADRRDTGEIRTVYIGIIYLLFFLFTVSFPHNVFFFIFNYIYWYPFSFWYFCIDI